MIRKNKIINIKANNKAQVTIFIIFGLILVVLIALIILVQKPVTTTTKLDAENPSQYIQACTRDSLDEVLDLIIPQGGFVDPEFYKLYEDKRVIYLCYINQAYKTCVMQHPSYINDIKTEIKNYIEPKVRDCFAKLSDNLEKKNYVVNDNLGNINVELGFKTVQVNIDKQFYISKNNVQEKYDRFEVKVINPIYDLALIAQEIANQEAKYCNFEYVGYMALHPEIEIGKFQTSDGVKIYKIKEKASDIQLNIAIKSCYYPPGLG